MESFNNVINYMACIIQRPYEKRSYSQCFVSNQGIGKNTVWECFGLTVGLDNFKCYKIENYVHKFSDTTKNILTIIEEVQSRVFQNKSFNETFKAYITNSNKEVELKNQNITHTSCFNNFIFFSNNRDAFKPIAPDARRYAIHFVDDKMNLLNKSFDEKSEYWSNIANQYHYHCNPKLGHMC